MEKLRILVVDDSLVYRRILTAATESTGLGSVVQTASNGVIALERLSQNNYDVVLLDQFMPEMTGLETLAVIRRDYPQLEVIMISSSGKDNALTTVKALQMGALDFILKPNEDNADKSMELIKNQLHILFAQVKLKRCNRKETGIPKETGTQEIENIGTTAMPTKVKPEFKKMDLVLIAASTGGPKALETVFSHISGSISQPILVIQHMPAEFTRVLADSLAHKCPLPVREGSEGMAISQKGVIIAPGGLHMTVMEHGLGQTVLHMDDSAFVNGVRPAADVLFHSVAQVYSGMNILTIIMTGMGNDGLQGVKELKQKTNCYCITQSEATSTIYGMPKSIYDAGLSDEVADLPNIASRIRQIVLGRC